MGKELVINPPNFHDPAQKGNSPNCILDLLHSGHAFCCNLCSKLFALAAEFDTPKTIIEKYFCNPSAAKGGECDAFRKGWYLILQLTGAFYWLLSVARCNATVGKDLVLPCAILFLFEVN